MTFYEQELRKIVGSQYPDATYLGRACYVRLGEMNRAKIQFVTGMIGSQYNALQLTILKPLSPNGTTFLKCIYGSAAHGQLQHACINLILGMPIVR